ncbi:MAG: hypothetical protein HFH48_08975 [Lachnospiraceae bacterium]|nr:hypothetical protein [Lachnospiraceae bacterium]
MKNKRIQRKKAKKAVVGYLTDGMQEIGAYAAQGYRYAKPVPEDIFEERLDRDS